MKQRFRPQRSVSLLHGIIRIAMISRKRVIAVWTPLTVVSRSSLMSAIITFMFEPAKLQMNCASASGRIRRRAAATGRSTVGAWLMAAGWSVIWSPFLGVERRQVEEVPGPRVEGDVEPVAQVVAA